MEALLQRRPLGLAKGLDKVSGSCFSFKQDKKPCASILGLGDNNLPCGTVRRNTSQDDEMLRYYDESLR